MRWSLRSHDPQRAAELTRALKIRPTTARILTARGIDTPEAATAFLTAGLSQLEHPRGLPDMDIAVDRLAKAIRSQETVGLYADYDVDGLSGAAQLFNLLKGVGVPAVVSIPQRLTDGYGVHHERMIALKQQGARLILTIDCGAKAHDTFALLRVEDLDIIVIDHHSLDPQPLPVLAYINPLRLPEASPWRVLCSSGLAFHLIAALRAQLRDEGFWGKESPPSLMPALELATLGTVGDMVPLTGPNRIIVRQGIRHLGTTCHPGLKALKMVSGLNGPRLDASDVGFRLCPRINAAGRLGDPMTAFHVMTLEETDRVGPMAEDLEKMNQLRRAEEERIVKEALAQAGEKIRSHNPPVLVLAAAGWHPGVVGIVASRIVEKTGRPALVIGIHDGLGRGSGRGIEGIDLVHLLGAASQKLERFGGHQQAVGLTIRPEHIEPFAEQLNAVFLSLYPDFRHEPQRWIDAIWDPEDDIASLAREFENLGPFGCGFPEPNLLFQRLDVIDGRVVGQGHLKLILQAGDQRIEGIAFRQAPEPFSLPKNIDILGIPEANHYRDSVYHRINIKEFRKSSAI